MIDKARVIKHADRHDCRVTLGADIEPIDLRPGDVALCTCGARFIRIEDNLHEYWSGPLKEPVPESEWDS